MEKHLKNQKKPTNNDVGGLSDYARFSGMAFEMIVIIGGTTWGGVKLDELADTKPLFTVILSLFGVAAAIYIVIKGLLKRFK